MVPIVLNVPIAQWIARWTSNPEVVGSNPTGDDVLLNFDLIIFPTVIKTFRKL